jgi:hypothetical protein
MWYFHVVNLGRLQKRGTSIQLSGLDAVEKEKDIFLIYKEIQIG